MGPPQAPDAPQDAAVLYWDRRFALCFGFRDPQTAFRHRRFTLSGMQYSDVGCPGHEGWDTIANLNLE